MRKKGANFRGKQGRDSAVGRFRSKLATLTTISGVLQSEVLDPKSRLFQALESKRINTSNYSVLNEMQFRGVDEPTLKLLADSGNRALVLSDLGLGAEYHDTLLNAQRTMAEIVASRDRKTGLFFATREQCRILSEMVTIHDGQLESPYLVDSLVDKAKSQVELRIKAGAVITLEPQAQPAAA